MSSLLNRNPEVQPIQGPDGRITTASPTPSPVQQFEQIASQQFEGLGQVGFTEAGSLEELANVQVGDFTDPLTVGLQSGVLHNIFRPEGQTLEAQSALAERASGYAELYGVRSFLSEAAGGLISDAPIDIALALTGIGLGNSITSMAAKGVGGASMKRAARSVQQIRDAYDRKSGMKLLTRARKRAVVEFGAGMAAAGISEGLQNLDGKGSTAEDVWNRMLMEGTASVLFSEVLRQGWRGGKNAYQAFAKKVNQQLPKGQQLNPSRVPAPLQGPVQGPVGVVTGPALSTVAGPVGTGTRGPELGPTQGVGGLGIEGPTGRTLTPEQGPTQGPVTGTPLDRPAEFPDTRPVEGADRADRPRPLQGPEEGETLPLGPTETADIPFSIRNIEDAETRELVEDLYLDTIIEAQQAEPDFTGIPVPREVAGIIEDAMAESGHLVQFRDQGKGNFVYADEVELNADNVRSLDDVEARQLQQEGIDEGPVTETRLYDSVKSKTDAGTTKVSDVIDEVMDELERVDPELAADLRRVIDASDQVMDADVKVGDVNGRAFGTYDPATHTVTMRSQPRNSDNFAKSMGHEILHAATAREAMARIQDVKLQGKSFRDDPELREIGDMMLELDNAVKRGDVSDAEFASNWNDNIMEFISEGLSNPNVQSAMRKVLDADNRNMLQRFWDWVAQLWRGAQLKPDSVRKLSEASARLAQSDVRATGDKLNQLPTRSKRKKKTTSQKPMTQTEIAQAKARKNNEADTKVAKQINKDYVKGSHNPVTNGAKRFWKAMSSTFAVMTVNNMSLMDTLNGLGPTMQKLVGDMKTALDKASEIKNEMMRDLESLNRTAAEVAALSDPKKAKTVAYGGKNYRLNGIQRLSLWMDMADGVSMRWLEGKGDFEWNELPSSGFARIVEHTNKKGDIKKGAGVRIDAKRDPVHLTDAEFKNAMRSESLLSADEKKIAMKMLKTYNKHVPWLNGTYKHLLGQKLVKGDGKYAYAPLRSEQADDIDELINYQGILRGKLDVIDIPGFLKQRGNQVLTLEDPFALMNSYIKRVPDAVAYAQPARIALHALGATSGSPQALKKFMQDTMGHTAYKNTVAMVRNLYGDRSGIAGPKSPGFGRMISLANMAKLSLNPITALKQWGSLWTAQSSGVIPGLKGSKVWADAVALTTNKAERDALIKEARAISPFFDYRQRDYIAFLDDDALQGDEFARLMMLSEGRPTIKEIRDMVKRKGLRRRDAWYEMVSRGLGHIKFADEVALAALWKATKESGIPQSQWSTKFRDLVLESQPTYDNLTRSMNQLNRDEFSRSIAAFSTQTRKNAAMIMNTTYEKLINNKNVTADDWREWFEVVGPLVTQTAYITAAGTVGAVGTGAVLTALESPKAAERNENLREMTTKKIVQRFARDLLGQIPSLGGDAAVMLANQLLGSTSFAAGITPVTDFEEALKVISMKDGSPRFNMQQFIRALSGTFGSRYAGQLAASASTRITD